MNGDTMSAAMWLHLLKSRKQLTAADLAPVAGCTRERADSILSIMATRAYVRGYRHPARKNGRAYAIDAACLLPRWLTLQQVLEATGHAGMPEAEEIEAKTKDRPMPPRGDLGRFGKVSSVFALGQQ